MIRAIGFDLDNTLFDHTAAAGSAMAMLIEQNGWQYKGSESITREWNRVERIYFPMYQSGAMELMEHRRARMRDFMTSTDASADEDRLELLWNQYVANYSQCWVAYPDAVESVEELKSRGYKLAVLTNGQQEQQEAKLKAIGMGDLFEVCIGIGVMEALKPDLRAFAQLCRVLECRPDEVLFVGDDIYSDVTPSMKTGMKAVWLNRHALAIPHGITLHIQSLAELKGILD